MSARLDRYAEFLEKRYRADFRKSDEYSIAEVTPELRTRISSGRFRRIVISGTGCPAVVSDVVGMFLNASGAEVEVLVVDGCDFPSTVPRSVADDEGTLFVINSDGGHAEESEESEESVRAFRALAGRYHRTLLLTPGGQLAELGRRAGVSVACWELSEPHPDYPLLHVGRHVGILLDMFHRLGLISQGHRAEVAALADDLATDFTPALEQAALETALRSQDANIILLASPNWSMSLPKLANMHCTETGPDRRHSILLFRDSDDDAYARNKMDSLIGLMKRDIPQNRNVTVTEIVLDQPTFLRKYFTALEFVQHTALHLGRLHDTRSPALAALASKSA
ncbi:hypothetical protein [Catenulispora rubra]|uniref:hypothetical protein n=1 Tax=Catenulispora rubra TaxID=280293 RepID=UPI0018924542|nr:hypothetical protein [Catenulispora rubra]